MPDPLLRTQVSLPRLRHILFPRKIILRRLNDSVQDEHFLTLVPAPSGYGITTSILMGVVEAG